MSLRVFAPAKINLTLEVGWPYRATGRHPLQSVVAFADVGDWIEAAPADELRLEIAGPFAAGLAADADNLVLRAARALIEAAPPQAAGAALRLEKNLPIASGIGGGSSDAAAALKALNTLWSLGLSDARLAEIARPLGGDVPVCVHGKSAYMTGEGEIVTPLALPPLDAVLVNPRVPVSTAAVFHRFDAIAGGAGFASKPPPQWRSADDVVSGLGERGNMLENAARDVAPILAEIAAALRADPRTAACGLSGSGATMFALAADADDAHALAHTLAREHPSWWIAATRLAAA